MPTPHPADPTGMPTPHLRALSALWAIPPLSRRLLRPAEPFGVPKAHSAEPSPISVSIHRSGHPAKRPGRTNRGPGSKDRIPQNRGGCLNRIPQKRPGSKKRTLHLYRKSQSAIARSAHFFMLEEGAFEQDGRLVCMTIELFRYRNRWTRARRPAGWFSPSLAW